MNRVKSTSTIRKKSHLSNAKKNSKKSRATRHILKKEPVKRGSTVLVSKSAASPHIPAPAHVTDLSRPLRDHAFGFQVDSISGETTIGDLIVAFPHTRDVLMKHGLRFDVEDAGYLYLTLNVFSAVHGLTSHSLIQELHATAKERVPPPIQAVGPIPTMPAR